MTETASRFHEMVRQNGQLLTQIAELRSLAVPPAGTACATGGHVAERLGGLCQGMRCHFAFEEEGGYLDVVVAARPGLFFNVSRLQREHAELLREGECLAEALRAAPTGTEARTRLVRLLDQIGRHQHEEHRLLQQALADDLGTGD